MFSFVKQGWGGQLQRLTPTPAQMEKIQTLAVGDVEPEALFVGQMRLCNDQYDRANERFPEAYLRRFEETMPGKSVLAGHNYSSLPIGRFFEAEVQKVDGTQHLVTRYYMMSADERVPLIQAGVIKDVSIGFYGDVRQCDICEKDYDGWWWSDDEDACNHISGHTYDGQKCTITWAGDEKLAEGIEGSFVYLGCQYGAQSVPVQDGAPVAAMMGKAAHFRERLAKTPAALAGGPNIPPGTGDLMRAVAAAKQPAVSIDQTLINARMPIPNRPLASATETDVMRMAAYGNAYVKTLRERIISRYSALDMKEVGELIAIQIGQVPAAKAEELLRTAEAAFEKRFPPAGRGEPDVEQAISLIAGQFDPLRFGVRGGF